MGGISLWQLLIVFAIVVLLFGTKKLRSMGSDLGSAVKGFKNAVSDKDKDADFDNEQQMEDKSTGKDDIKPSSKQAEPKESK